MYIKEKQVFFMMCDYEILGTQLLHIAEANFGSPMTLKIAMDNLKPCGFYEKYGWYKASQHDDASEPYLLYKKD